MLTDDHTRGVHLTLLRHGEPQGGALYRGRRDDPLSPAGWTQLQAATAQPTRWCGIVTSPLQRCAAFAQTLGEERDIPVYLEPRLQELDFGRWEGRTAEVILAEDHAQLTAFWSDPVRHPPPQGETMEAFAERINAAFVDWQERMRTGPWLWVVHGGVIRVLLTQLLGMPLEHLLRIEVPYACRSTVILGDGAPRLLAHGALVNE
ncbi:histidine phosphatase family protein [Candidatus Macondimonas diazotrophica]|jgi:broad specificity phosphatase PhoE|uniref:Histidine phosphatase family protein n=1 Tax=Candidatus Macondimonas diazotrophica TaxID=2305248 RepID=A0A4Z0F9P0_9GAMM|nr:alpha-ribazole phosphatase family protein [Candidatus Macondimonas diazotrophica]NCU00821.1 alpha-ribazole phosphatase family protein [Candidatus Macondimonas diazotrophica]TFZ82578.1 histidine phosphatase family protein [Candidatus Macondimonas diazotrophica]